jgi:predicted nucleic acid-binding protein
VIKEFVPEIGSELIDKVTTSARQGTLQIITSVWAINEAIAVIDRLTRKPQHPLSQSEKQEIIATFAERVRESNEQAAYRYAPIEHALVANSRMLIDGLHISPDDALHLYTAYVYDCEYFLIHDNKIISRLKAEKIEGMTIIDLADEADRAYLENQLDGNLDVETTSTSVDSQQAIKSVAFPPELFSESINSIASDKGFRKSSAVNSFILLDWKRTCMCYKRINLSFHMLHWKRAHAPIYCLALYTPCRACRSAYRCTSTRPA